MNSFLNNLTDATNFTRTDNGALAHKSTRSYVYDMFAFGGAYRGRSNEDCILLFKNALQEDAILAMKCLFYLRDVRGGQGERRFFRVCFKWIAKAEPEFTRRFLPLLSEYGRWDDLIYTTIDTPVWNDAVKIIKTQLALDVESKTPSLLGKWMPSENASSVETKRAAAQVRNALGVTHRQYRKTLSILRTRINIVEKLMSENRWEEIEFDKIPSKAGIIYKNAFARRDIIAKKYETFAKDTTTKVNAKTLYPYDVTRQAYFTHGSETDRVMIEKYWNNLPDYFNGDKSNILCVVDTSASMRSGYNLTVSPMDVACSLGIYAAERSGGPFKDHYISFSSEPQLVKFEGVDFVDKVQRCYKTNLCQNTNIEATFKLLRNIALEPTTKKEDIPETIVIISDMQIDSMTGPTWRGRNDGVHWTQESATTEMEWIRADWEAHGLKCPKLIYWNVNASNNTILDAGPDVSFVSGCSPVLFEQIVKGISGYDLMLAKLNSERYAAVQ